MYQKIVNPITNRPVSLYGKIGQCVLTNYLRHFQTGGAESEEDSHNKPKRRLDDGVEFEYFKTPEEALHTIGTSYNIAEMPDNTYITYLGDTYLIKEYDNKGYVICYKLGSQNQKIEGKPPIKLDASLNVIYLGNTPSIG